MNTIIPGTAVVVLLDSIDDSCILVSSVRLDTGIIRIILVALDLVPVRYRDPGPGKTTKPRPRISRGTAPVKERAERRIDMGARLLCLAGHRPRPPRGQCVVTPVKSVCRKAGQRCEGADL
eukprot:COSAG02_NODE_692_length_18432_cov_12.452681_2_plen_121_part_00